MFPSVRWRFVISRPVSALLPRISLANGTVVMQSTAATWTILLIDFVTFSSRGASCLYLS